MWITLIVIATIIIWRAGDFFSSAATYIQEKHEIPQSIKAAVIDAIVSSFPEFCVAVIAVILIGRGKSSGHQSGSYLEGQHFLSWRCTAAGRNALVLSE